MSLSSCVCQEKGKKTCPSHPRRGHTPEQPYGSGRSRRRLEVIIARDGPTCYYCEADLLDPDVLATTDHRIPLARGGSNTLENLVAACYVCNHAKNNMTEEEFRNAPSAIIYDRLLRARIDARQKIQRNENRGLSAITKQAISRMLGRNVYSIQELTTAENEALLNAAYDPYL